MKKSLLAVAVLGAFAGAAQAQSSVTIYGIIDTSLAYTSKAINEAGTGTGSKLALNSGLGSGSRIGFKGTEDLGGGLSAVFHLETGFKSENGGLEGADTVTSQNLFRRRSVVGLSGGFGSVLLGRQTDFADSLGGYTSGADFGGFTSAAASGGMGTRLNNSVSYTTADLSGFTASAIYGFGEKAGQTKSGQSLGLGGKYANGPLGLGLNYHQSKQGSTPSDTRLTGAPDATQAGNAALKVLNVVASYEFGPARVYGNYSRVKRDLNKTTPERMVDATPGAANKVDVYELGTAWSLSPSLKLLGAVTQSRADFNSSTKGKLTQFSLGTDYWLSKRTDLYAFVGRIRASNMANSGVLGDATGNATTGGADSGQTAAAVGIRHKF